MSLNLFRNRIAILAVVFLLIAAFGFLLFHHHADGDHSDCSACQLVQQLVLFLVPVIIFIFAGICRTYSFALVSKLTSFLLPENLQGRAPPRIA